MGAGSWDLLGGGGCPGGVRCSGITRSGTRCERSAEGSNGLCWAHAPENADKHRQLASRAGKAKPRREQADVKLRLSDLSDEVLTGKIDKGVGAIVSQILNVLGTIARFSPEACEEAFINFTNRLGAGEDAPPEHPLIAAARNSSDPTWTSTFFADEDPERWVEPVEDLSERGTRPARLPPNRLMGAAGI
jgi:hypothetical protein